MAFSPYRGGVSLRSVSPDLTPTQIAAREAALAAQAAAEAAQGLAETAQTGAEAAKSGSEGARDAAVVAQGLAEDAQAAAEAVGATHDAQTAANINSGPLTQAALETTIAARTARVFQVTAQPSYAAYPASSSAAVNEAIAEAVAAGGGDVMLPPGRSKWDTAIDPIPTGVSVLGYAVGGQTNADAPSAITVASGINGIENRGAKNRIADFLIESQEAGVGTSVGLLMRGTRANYANITVRNFGSHGYKCDASIGGGSPNGYNANVSRIEALRAVNNGGYGLHISGTDANVLTGHFDATGNKLGGVYNAAQRANLTGHLANNSVATGATVGKGNYADLTAYAVGDAVWYSGAQYVALVTIGSGNTTPPAVGASWAAGGAAIVDAGYSNRYEFYIEGGTGDRIVATASSVDLIVDVPSFSGGVFDDSLAPDAVYTNNGRIWNKGYWRKKLGIGDDTTKWYWGVGRATAGGTLDLYNVTAAKRIFSLDPDGTLMRMVAELIPTTDAGQSLGRSANKFKRLWVSAGSAGGIAFGSGKPIWTSGAGTPEGSVTGAVGSLYTREDGGAGTTLYVKETGAGNTGWVAK